MTRRVKARRGPTRSSLELDPAAECGERRARRTLSLIGIIDRDVNDVTLRLAGDQSGRRRSGENHAAAYLRPSQDPPPRAVWLLSRRGSVGAAKGGEERRLVRDLSRVVPGGTSVCRVAWRVGAAHLLPRLPDSVSAEQQEDRLTHAW